MRPREVVVVNLFEPGHSDESWLQPITGDACQARDALAAVHVAAEFDVVFSNSLIEHLGGHAKRTKFADEVLAIAPYHWIQTPYRYFPLEPHYLFPFMQHLPMSIRGQIAFSWPLSHTRPSTLPAARSEVQWTELLSLTEMRSYFPASSMYRERVAGLVKSISAVRSPGAA